jgi:twitching motility protein PilI
MATRIPLESFEAELARKLADSVNRPVAAAWLGVAWQGVRALLPLSQAGEIFNPVALQRLPHTQPWALGVASLRGGLAVVVDWVRLLELPVPMPARGDDDTVYWVALNPALGVGAALCVDRLLGLHDVAAFEPDARPTDRPGVKRMCRDAQGQLWYELDVQALVASPRFLDPRLPAFAAPHGAAH